MESHPRMAQYNHTRHAQFTCAMTHIKAHPLNATMQSHGLHAPSTKGRTAGTHKEKTDNQKLLGPACQTITRPRHRTTYQGEASSTNP